jgi:GT2 family glycosyltransferase
MDSPSVSVVVPAYRAERTLARCLEAALAQDIAAPYEVVLVTSADGPGPPPAVPDDPRLRLIHHSARVTAAAARNVGVRAARAGTVVFLDADAVPAGDWLRRLVAAAGEADIIAGAVENGTPESVVGTAEYLAAFLDLAPRRNVATAWHGATCNLLVTQAAWEDYGPFPEDLLGGEDTLMTASANRDGRLRFCPDARVVHLNRTRLGAVLAHQYMYGRFTAQIAQRGPYQRRPLVRHAVLAPVAGLGRVGFLAWRAPKRMAAPRRRVLLSAPAAVAAIGAWTAGLTVEGVRLQRRRRRRPPPPP